MPAEVKAERKEQCAAPTGSSLKVTGGPKPESASMPENAPSGTLTPASASAPKFFCARYAASRAMVLMRCASAVIAAISPVSLRSTSMRSSYPTPESVASIASCMAEAALARSAASATERMTPAALKKRMRKRRSGTSRTSAKKMRRLHLVRGVT